MGKVGLGVVTESVIHEGPVWAGVAVRRVVS
jgi:hypothetical protein